MVMEPEEVVADKKLFQYLPDTAIQILSRHLKPNVGCDNNWRSLAGVLNFSHEMVVTLEDEQEPVISMFRLWQIERGNQATVDELISALRAIRRLDCIEDITEYVEKTPTLDDVRKNQGLEFRENSSSSTVKENYDVFIAYAAPDIHFARFLLMKLEDAPYNLSVCINYRDFLPGENALAQISNVIENKCRKVIVILSDDFNQCELSDFQAKLALSISPSCRKRILIPVLYKPCEIPLTLRMIHHVDYSETEFREYFWTKLKRALQT